MFIAIEVVLRKDGAGLEGAEAGVEHEPVFALNGSRAGRVPEDVEVQDAYFVLVTQQREDRQRRLLCLQSLRSLSHLCRDTPELQRDVGARRHKSLRELV